MATAILVLGTRNPVHAVDALSNLTGMDDSPYYRYEVRGQSSISILLSQSLWEGGAVQARIDMEKARLANAKHLYKAAASSLVFDAVAAHVDVMRQTRLVALAKKNMEDYSDTVAMLRSRLDNGLATEGDISLVESRLYRAEGVLAEYTAALEAARASFFRTTGKSAPERMEAVPHPKKFYKNLAAVISSCQMRNPQILAQGESISASQQQEKIANAAFLPKFAIEAGPRWNFQDTPQDKRNHGVEAMLTAQWNLFEGGASKAAKSRAAAQTRQARQDRQTIADSLQEDISSTWASYLGAGERMQVYKKSMDAASNARALFYEQYMLGDKGLLDMLDADNEFFISACQHEIASGDRIIGAYRLLALGGDIMEFLNIPFEWPDGDKKAARPKARP